MFFLTFRSKFRLHIQTSIVCLIQRGLCAYINYVVARAGVKWKQLTVKRS